MANVKISELPQLGVVSPNNVIVVNDASSNTTCKSTIKNAVVVNKNIAITPPTGCTMTVNGNSASTATASIAEIAGCVGKITWSDRITLTNTTGSRVALTFKATESFAAIAGNPITICGAHVGSCVDASDNPITQPCVLQITTTDIRFQRLIGGASGLGTIYVPANGTVDLSYINVSAIYFTA